jgi:hypothetical protein
MSPRVTGQSGLVRVLSVPILLVLFVWCAARAQPVWAGAALGLAIMLKPNGLAPHSDKAAHATGRMPSGARLIGNRRRSSRAFA